jgi:galactokinase
MTNPSDLRNRSQEWTGKEPRIFRAPGRVNLIGEHTDYNEGFVMPAAVDFYTWVAITPRDDGRLRLMSLNFDEELNFDPSDTYSSSGHHWSDYVRGVAMVLKSQGKKLPGADLLISGDVPLGSGLSSSAAIEVASGYALLTLAGEIVSRNHLALACQRAEHEYVGTRCGIMDQFISANGKAGHALMLDCRSLDYSLLPLRNDVSLVVCNTMVKHELASGEYNTRRRECEAGVKQLNSAFPSAKFRALRDVRLDQLQEASSRMDNVIYRRCRHVVTENARVGESARHLQSGDLRAFGKLMAASHASLRDDYEVSCRELDFMVEIASRQPGLLGARMTGGGFGGCTINLVEAASAAGFSRTVAEGYQQATGTKPDIYVCRAAEGAHEFTPAMEEAEARKP